ncbi:hypothetical protein FQN57_005192 [Myotisia sp. PD_48]|nr:hypothetical protein FQN57_005192 [Myotisia sp. PD_48]
MGGICSRSSNEPDHFAQTGRVLGTTTTPAPAPTTSRLPPRVERASKQPGNMLGGDPDSPQSPRSAAARAAAERADKQASVAKKGPLASRAAANSSKTQSQLLDEASRENQAHRKLDDSRSTQQWH